jgi:hypothetical protein
MGCLGIPVRITALTIILSVAFGPILLSPALSQTTTLRPKEVQSRPPAPAAIEPASTADTDALQKAIAPLVQNLEKLAEEIQKLSGDIDGLKNDLRKGQRPTANQPSGPWWQYWTLLLLGLATLVLIAMQFASRRRARTHTAVSRAPEPAAASPAWQLHQPNNLCPKNLKPTCRSSRRRSRSFVANSPS